MKGKIVGYLNERMGFEMKIKLLPRTLTLAIAACLFVISTGLYAAPAPEPNIDVRGYFSNDRAPRGRTIQAAIVMEIPSGYHVNSIRQGNKYSIPTSVKIEAPRGVRVGPVIYPRAIVRKLKAVNNEALSVYEGRTIFRFNVTLPANYQGGEAVLKAHVRYQSCNDEVCFPPKNHDVDMGIGVAGANDRVQRANGWVFGRR